MLRQNISIDVPGAGPVSALMLAPENPGACYVIAHGAGAGMIHPFMEAVAESFAGRGIATLRYQFPYMERGSRRPDAAKIAHATVAAAVAEAGRRMPDTPLFAGGKSYGGRMTSQRQAEAALPGVRGLVFLGFPLHPAGKPSGQRAQHLFEVDVPMLFLQGTRDKLADLTLLEPVVENLGGGATLRIIDHADHSFHVLVRSGRNDSEVLQELAQLAADWMMART